jgi:hypothetical protein
MMTNRGGGIARLSDATAGLRQVSNR